MMNKSKYDFLVNMYEDNLGVDAIEAAYHNIFRTQSGKKLCKEMFVCGEKV